ncbi:hypothetical protein XF_2123 [Xylella fastidiosa 9a5c]|uniref:Uncharacterized protein n=1 Tax=Xylella fastidiosa (strain 9a5c) TaxID=160492 RepID=Q9P9Q5_XYLFA|nr:hypothetical protein XF_0504 [Xylella fastidiosa 9a5c]AAF84922.1 hypothetical protein XF_2123 [Xylella fastidiosa 9a5c]
MMARHRLPSGYRRQGRGTMTPRQCAGLRAALAALYSSEPGLSGAAALAARERMWVDAEASQRKQGVLLLRGGT